MSRSQNLYHLQELDTALDNALHRIQEIDALLKDQSALEKAQEQYEKSQAIHTENQKALKNAEYDVSIQNEKLEQNQKKLYSGGITNPKELEDLQLESNSLSKYLQVLEERQLEAMLIADQSQADLAAAEVILKEVTQATEQEHNALTQEKENLEAKTMTLSDQKAHYIGTEDLPDLPAYKSLREASGGIAVTLMTDSSCSSCGASIPSAIEQTAKSPTNLAFCPTCKRILHPRGQ
jgi:predicted  nucleic acid-binding Zn-ribbon protein